VLGEKKITSSIGVYQRFHMFLPSPGYPDGAGRRAAEVAGRQARVGARGEKVDDSPLAIYYLGSVVYDQ
jgi:hypothetical protein